MKQQTVKIILSPFNPNVETVGALVLSVSVPSSDKMVTLKLNPNIQDYQENADTEDQTVQVRQVMVTTDTEDTKTLTLDLGENNTQEITLENKKYEIKLLDISKENLQGQDFPSYEFLVTEK